MPGLSNEVRSIFWKFFHYLLPTQSRLNRITRTVNDPCCIHCDSGEPDHAWYHTFKSCSASKPLMDWLLVRINLIPIQCDSIDEALWLQFTPAICEIDLLSAVWLVGETLAYTWARRQNRENMDTQTLTAMLKIKASQMSKSTKHSQCGKNVCTILNY